jgi:Ca2+-binding RTX toxin-like protein
VANFDASQRKHRISWTPSTYFSAFSELLSQNWTTVSGVENNQQGQKYRYAFDDDLSHYVSITLASGRPQNRGYAADALSYFIGIENPDGSETTHSEYYVGDMSLDLDLLGTIGIITNINTFDEVSGIDYGSVSASGRWDAARLSSAGTGQAAHQVLFEGNDTITGSSFDDEIDSSLGDDVVYAGAGNDRIADGIGWNTLYGQGGSDTFVVRPGVGSVLVRQKKDACKWFSS